MNKKIVIGTRFFARSANSEESFSKFRSFIQRVQRKNISGEKIIIAVSADEDKSDILNKKDQFPGTDIFGVTPWINNKDTRKDFILPLNAIVSRATLGGAGILLLVSSRVKFS